jgi:serine/threonine protein kinase
LEYIEGGELFDYLIKKGRLEEREAVNYFRQIVQGVHYCHKFNICHRDLKPENLLLDKDRNIKIADFGMAALETNDRMLETSCGSPHYASPEIVAGKNYHGGPSDIWSCGIILFALLTGHLPFDDENIRRLLMKVQSGRFVMPEELSLEAKDLISRMLRINPAERISMPEILKHPLLKKHPQKRMATSKARRLPTTSGTSDVTRPVMCREDVDQEILKNLQTLWHGEDVERIIDKLLADELNSEKTFYCLLMKYRHDHRHDNDDSEYQKVAKRRTSQPVQLNAASHRRKSSQSIVASRPSAFGHKKGSSGHHSRNGSKSSVITNSSSHKRNIAHSAVKKQPQQQLQYEKVRKNSSSDRPVRTGSVSSSKPKVQENEFNFVTQDQRSSVYDSNLVGEVADAENEVKPVYGRAVSNPVPVTTQPKPERRAFSLQGNASVERRASVFDPGSRPYSVMSTNSSHSTASTSTNASSMQQDNGVLPKIFEEDRFADAIEEEVDDKLNGGLSKESRYRHIKKDNKSNNGSPDLNNELERMIQTRSTDELYKGLHLPANDVQPAVRPPQSDESRLQIAGLMKTDSFKMRSQQGIDDIKYRDVTPPLAVVETKKRQSLIHQDQRKSSEQQQQQVVSRKERRKPLASKDVNKERKDGMSKMKAPPPPPPTFAAQRPPTPPPETENNNRSTSIFKKLVPKRPPPPAPASSPWVDALPPSPTTGEAKQNWFMKMLSSTTSSAEKAEPVKKTIYSTLPTLRLRQVIMEILTHWKQYGITRLSEDSAQSIIRANISSRNVLKVRSSRFQIQIQTIRGVAAAVFTKEKGSTTSYERFLGEIERAIEQITREHHAQFQRRQKRETYQPLRPTELKMY